MIVTAANVRAKAAGWYQRAPLLYLQCLAAVTWQLRLARGAIPLQHNYFTTYCIC